MEETESEAQERQEEDGEYYVPPCHRRCRPRPTRRQLVQSHIGTEHIQLRAQQLELSGTSRWNASHRRPMVRGRLRTGRGRN